MEVTTPFGYRGNRATVLRQLNLKKKKDINTITNEIPTRLSKEQALEYTENKKDKLNTSSLN